MDSEGHLHLFINEQRKLFAYRKNKGAMSVDITVSRPGGMMQGTEAVEKTADHAVVTEKTEPAPSKATPAKPLPRGRKGFIQVAPSKRYFQYEGGASFFPIGQNEWPRSVELRTKTKKDLDQYFRNLNEHGVNVLRLLLDVGHKEKSLFVETAPGQFNPKFKQWMDMIVGLAEKYDVYLIIALYPNIEEKSVGNWRFYPYSRKSGKGDLEKSSDMITSPKAKEYEKRRFRYFVDNWGHSSHIFSWELFNEFWHPDKKKSKLQALKDHNQWIDEMGAYMKQYEMEKMGRYHLRSVSTMRSDFPRDNITKNKKEARFFDAPNLDFASFHGYGQIMLYAMNTKSDLSIVAGKKITTQRLVHGIHKAMNQMLKRAPGRPIINTEAFMIANPKSKAYKNPVNFVRRMVRNFSDAQRFDLFHAANWTYIMSGAAGTAERFPEEFFEDEMYDRLLVISRFAAKVPWPQFKAKPAHDQVTCNRRDILPLALSDGRMMIAWLYHDVPYKSRKMLQPQVTFGGLKEGKYRITWINSHTAEELKTDIVKKVPFTVQAPGFKGHVACIIKPE